jgi:hypothetical protein
LWIELFDYKVGVYQAPVRDATSADQVVALTGSTMQLREPVTTTILPVQS